MVAFAMHEHLKIDLGGDLLERGITALLNQLSALRAQNIRIEDKIDKLGGGITPADEARMKAHAANAVALAARLKVVDEKQ